MQKATKIIWIITVVIAIVALIYFFAVPNPGNYSQAAVVNFLFFAFPSLFFVLASTIFLIKNEMPNRLLTQIALIIFLVMFTVIFPGNLFFPIFR